MICTDKTGTLTAGRMAVRLVWADGEELAVDAGKISSDRRSRFAALARAAVRCNNASLQIEDGQRRLAGDPSESALLVAALELGEDVVRSQAERGARRRKAYAFDPHLKRMTTLDEEPDGELVYHAKGAPLELLERCTSVRRPTGTQVLDAETRSEIQAAFESLRAPGATRVGVRRTAR